MPSPDVIIIKPGNQKELYGQLSDFNLTAIEPPLWGALMAGFLRCKDYGVELLDAEVERLKYMETAEIAVQTKPHLVLISVSGTNPSASTMNMTGAGQIAQHVKNLAPDIKIAMIGLHPSALPEQTLCEHDIDFVVQGEGFYTLPKLIQAVKSGQAFHNIAGLWYQENGYSRSNLPADLWPDLDTLPQPAWDLLPIDRYRAHNWHCFDHIDQRQPYAVIYTSLGCPFKCRFCCINSLFGQTGIRYRNPKAVIEEIDYLVNTFGVRNIKIMDEMFALNNEHVERFCDLIIERGYELNMWAYARVNTVDRKMLSKMKRAGINWVAYGFESGSKRVLKSVNKRYDPDSLFEVVRMTYDEGLYICGNYIFGLPEDDQYSMQATLDMAMEINAEWANIYTAMALPGSKLYQQALAEDWPLPTSWEGYSQYSKQTLPLPTKHLTSEQVLRFRDKAFTAYYHNPDYLQMIRKKFGVETADYIQTMASRKLERFYSDDHTMKKN